jgi:hypothetical protein
LNLRAKHFRQPELLVTMGRVGRWVVRTKEKGNHNVLSLMMSLAMFAVILLSLAAGVGLGYAIIFGILYAFDRSRQSGHGAPARVLNTTASGD